MIWSNFGIVSVATVLFECKKKGQTRDEMDEIDHSVDSGDVKFRMEGVCLVHFFHSRFFAEIWKKNSFGSLIWHPKFTRGFIAFAL